MLSATSPAPAMSKSSADFATTPERRPGRNSPTLFQELQEEAYNPEEIVTEAPKGHFRLGYLDLTCLVLNHVMGKKSPLPV